MNLCLSASEHEFDISAICVSKGKGLIKQLQIKHLNQVISIFCPNNFQMFIIPKS